MYKFFLLNLISFMLCNMMNTLCHKLKHFLNILSSFGTSLIIKTIKILSKGLAFFIWDNPFKMIDINFITNNKSHDLLALYLLIYLLNPILNVVFGINIWAIEQKNNAICFPIILLGQCVHSLVPSCIPYTHINFLWLIIIRFHYKILINSIKTNCYRVELIKFLIA